MHLLAMNPILSISAIIPAVFLLVKIYKADRIEKEPIGLLLSLVIIGIFSTSVAVALETLGKTILSMYFVEDSTAYNIIMYFGVVAFSEEGSKYVLLKSRTWKNRNFNCRYDGVVYATFVSLGFALWENIGYVASYGFSTALVRAVTAVPGHACFGVFMGVWYGTAKMYEARGEYEKSKAARVKSLLLAVFMHGSYDFLTTLQHDSLGLIFLTFVAAMFLRAIKLVKKTSAQDEYIYDNNDDFPI
jgi:protease PrsW